MSNLPTAPAKNAKSKEDSVAAPHAEGARGKKRIREVEKDFDANGKEDLGTYKSGGWYGIERHQDPALLNGKQCQGVPNHYRQTVLDQGGILKDEKPKQHHASTTLWRNGSMGPPPPKKQRKRFFQRMREGLDEEIGQEGFIVEDDSDDDHGSDVTRPSQSAPLPIDTSSSFTITPGKSSKSSGPHLASSSYQEGEGENPTKRRNLMLQLDHADPNTKVLLYDVRGNFTGAWSKVKESSDLHNMSICGVEGFVSYPTYEPPSAGDVEPAGLLLFRADLTKRNRELLTKSGCNAELIEDTIARSLDEDNLSWKAVIGMAREMSDEKVTGKLRLKGPVTSVLGFWP